MTNIVYKINDIIFDEYDKMILDNVDIVSWKCINDKTEWIIRIEPSKWAVEHSICDFTNENRKYNIL